MSSRAARIVSRSVIMIALLGCIVSAGVYVWHDRMLHTAGPHQQDVLVIVEPGDGHQVLRLTLNRAGVIHQIYHYDAARLLAGNRFLPKAGEFLLPAKSSLSQIMSIIHRGFSYQRRLTIVEGLRSADIVQMITDLPHLTGMIEVMPDEGSLRPETYFYTYATPRDDLINRMQQTQQIALAEAWIDRAEDLPYKTPQHALIMASIIEKEASVNADRHLVAAVLVNRLKRGMRLQSDPTVLYEAAASPQSPIPITKTHLKTKTPWNTYVIKGLPKTPICNPGEDSLMAALNPADSDYLYFVSDGKGGLRFAKTLDVHNRNVRLFRKFEAAAKKDKAQ